MEEDIGKGGLYSGRRQGGMDCTVKKDTRRMDCTYSMGTHGEMNVQWKGTNGGMDSTMGGDTRRNDLQWERIH